MFVIIAGLTQPLIWLPLNKPLTRQWKEVGLIFHFYFFFVAIEVHDTLAITDVHSEVLFFMDFTQLKFMLKSFLKKIVNFSF